VTVSMGFETPDDLAKASLLAGVCSALCMECGYTTP